jgi:type IV secretory pathway ATPase VirB11/archaellum biosynthesis ATPase
MLPLKQAFDRDEISTNRPNEVWVEYKGETFREELPHFYLDHSNSLAHLVAQSTEQRLSDEEPLLSATLPNGYRIQIASRRLVSLIQWSFQFVNHQALHGVCMITIKRACPLQLQLASLKIKMT